jgi:hypothetical protein
MGNVVLANQTPATPAAGYGVIFIDPTAKILMWKDDTGRANGFSSNAAIATQSGFAADTYVTDSSLLIPSTGVQARTMFRWRIAASKTAAGVAAPVYALRIGSARTTADTVRITLTGPAQTAVADIGTLNIMATVRNVGAAGVIHMSAWWDHTGTVASSTGGTGFANDSSGHVNGQSSAFDNSALAGLYAGLSINGGTSAAWTFTQVIAEATW